MIGLFFESLDVDPESTFLIENGGIKFSKIHKFFKFLYFDMRFFNPFNTNVIKKLENSR